MAIENPEIRWYDFLDTSIPVCPHCYKNTRAEFDDGNFTLGGNKATCEHCGKEFWFEADIRFSSRREEC